MSEWLPKFDVTTSFDDVMTRPSSFNPYPEHADEGIEVWGMSNPTAANPLYTIRYPKIDAGCRVTLPVSYETAEGPEKPELLEGLDLNGGYQGAEAANPDYWIDINDFWAGQSIDYADEYVTMLGREAGATSLFADIAEASGSVDDGIIVPEPRSFIRRAIAEVNREINDGQPETAYALAQMMFRGFSGEFDGRRLSNIATMNWISDGMPRVLYPNFTSSWDSRLDQHRITTVAHPYEIGGTSASLLTSEISDRALGAWLRTDREDLGETILDKVTALKESTSRRAIRADASLDTKLDQAGREFPEAVVDSDGYLNWERPANLGKYVTAVLSSAD